QSRPEHGRRRVLLGHGRGGDGGARGGHPQPRRVVRRLGSGLARDPQRRPARAAAPHRGRAGLSHGDAAQHQPPRDPGGSGQGRQGHPPRQPGVQRRDRADEGPLGERHLLDRRRTNHLDRRRRLRLPRDERRLHLGDTVAHGHDELRPARGRAPVVPRRLTPEGAGDTYGGYRVRLVENLRAKGIRDLAVLRAFAATPRHLFVPEAVRHRAYEDAALPIGTGQTISQPFTQARYLESLGLKGEERVLEIGTGSGYQTALLAALAAQVFTVERVRSLAASAQAALKAAGVTNVSLLVGDGTLGWSAYAPYHAILVAAGGPEIPPPLVEQLAAGGRMIIPLGAKGAQTLTLVRRTEVGIRAMPIGDARFVPLVGEHGFDA